MKALLAVLLGVPLFGATIFGLNYLGYLNVAFFAPKFEAVRRDTMIESRAYSEASIRRLYDLRREWQNATPEGRKTLEATIRHEFSIFSNDRLPADLSAFKQSIN